jgi:hypothetical protein
MRGHLRQAVGAATVVAIIGLASCGFNQAKQDGEKLVARHFQAVATNGYQAGVADYGNDFFKTVSREEWTKSLANLNSKLGAYQKHAIASWRVFRKVGSRPGTTVTFQCQVTYSKYPATETFTLFKGASESEYKIIGHQITSDGLLKDQ